MFNNVLAWRAEGVAATMQMQPTPGEQEQQAYVKPSFEAAYQNAVRLCWQGKNRKKSWKKIRQNAAAVTHKLKPRNV